MIPQAFTGGPDAALVILSAVATSMVSLAALVLTITMVVVQLAMGQFSPRIVQRILRDRPSQFAIGIFVATFAHAMLAMRDVRVGGGGQVPGLAVVVAFLLVLIDRGARPLRAPHRPLAARVRFDRAGRQGHAQAARRLLSPTGRARLAAGERVSWRPSSGVVCHVDFDRLVERAAMRTACLELVPALGEFAPSGAPLLRVDGDGPPASARTSPGSSSWASSERSSRTWRTACGCS